MSAGWALALELPRLALVRREAVPGGDVLLATGDRLLAAGHKTAAQGYAERAHVESSIVILDASGWLTPDRDNGVSSTAGPGSCYVVVVLGLLQIAYHALP